MAAGATYDKIASTTLATNQNTVSFTLIPQTYTDLVLIYSGTAIASTDAQVRVGNGTVDAGTNYSRAGFFGYSGGFAAFALSGIVGYIFSPYNGNTNLVMHLHSYSSTNMYKPALIRNGPKPASGDELTYASANIWKSTAAIDIISFVSASQAFASGSAFSIYGIKAA